MPNPAQNPSSSRISDGYAQRGNYIESAGQQSSVFQYWEMFPKKRDPGMGVGSAA
jgi:hypothetical protein